jgi:hypothetical protein
MADSVTYSYGADGTGVPSNNDPLNIYTRVFGALDPAGGPDPALLRRLARRQSVLDSVTADVLAFKRRLGTEDAKRADAQLTAIREMEKRLTVGVPAGPACTKPAMPGGVDFKSHRFVPETMRAFIDLTVAAMACNQTRVVMMHSYLREYHPPNFLCPWAPANAPTASFHGLSHDETGDGFAAFVRAKSFHFQLAGELANKLKAMPEQGGGNMLDRTVILIPTEIGRGHTHCGLQFVTIGGRGLGVKTGQYLFLGTQRQPGKGIPHQRLLVSLCNALGLADTRYGQDPGSGPLPGFLLT